MSITIGDIVQALSGSQGVIVFFVALFILFLKGDLCFGREVRRLEAEVRKLEHKNAALEQTSARMLMTAEEGRALGQRAVALVKAHAGVEALPAEQESPR